MFSKTLVIYMDDSDDKKTLGERLAGFEPYKSFDQIRRDALKNSKEEKSGFGYSGKDRKGFSFAVTSSTVEGSAESKRHTLEVLARLESQEVDSVEDEELRVASSKYMKSFIETQQVYDESRDADTSGYSKEKKKHKIRPISDRDLERAARTQRIREAEEKELRGVRVLEDLPIQVIHSYIKTFRREYSEAEKNELTYSKGREIVKDLIKRGLYPDYKAYSNLEVKAKSVENAKEIIKIVKPSAYDKGYRRVAPGKIRYVRSSD